MICRDNIGQPDSMAVGRVDVNFTEFVAESHNTRGGIRTGLGLHPFTKKMKFLRSNKKREYLRCRGSGALPMFPMDP